MEILRTFRGWLTTFSRPDGIFGGLWSQFPNKRALPRVRVKRFPAYRPGAAPSLSVLIFEHASHSRELAGFYNLLAALPGMGARPELYKELFRDSVSTYLLMSRLHE